MRAGWKNGAFIIAHVLFVVLALAYLYETSSIIRAGLS